ncbi:MAG TPA: M20/M25/M40 family metallo-hydrolase [Patescibacteria group bacterium]|nr:M20/M25/M40 family metallo-hydrolase [Patescibacteria group bacterium]
MNDIYNNYIKLLGQLVSLKSVSTNKKYVGDISATVEWFKKLFIKNNFSVDVIKSKNSNPIIVAKYDVSKNLKTLLIYGHYDVQPAEKSNGWKYEPFKLNKSNTKLFGRGIVDNKGQILIHIITALNLIKDKKLKYNLIFLIEGNEETGNPDMANVIKKYKDNLKSNMALISDGELTNDKPTIEISLRGGFNATLIYQTNSNNLHSGLYGGGVASAPAELTKFINKLINNNGQVNFKNFYIGMDKISKKELDNCKSLNLKAKGLMKSKDFFVNTGLKPTIQITGLKSGYIDEGYANIVPATAEARLNFRIVASQKAKTIAKVFEKFVKTNTPKNVKYELKINGLHDPIKINTSNQFVTKIEKLLENIYRSKVNRKNVGGAIPVVADFKKILNIDTLLIPLCNEDCNMHGTDENFDIKLIKKGLEFSNKLLSKKL